MLAATLELVTRSAEGLRLVVRNGRAQPREVIIGGMAVPQSGAAGGRPAGRRAALGFELR
jgi:hypothetical protein